MSSEETQAKTPRKRRFPERLRTTVRFKPSTLDALQAEADAIGISRNDMMERALEAFIRAKRPQRAPASVFE